MIQNRLHFPKKIQAPISIFLWSSKNLGRNMEKESHNFPKDHDTITDVQAVSVHFLTKLSIIAMWFLQPLSKKSMIDNWAFYQTIRFISWQLPCHYHNYCHLQMDRVIHAIFIIFIQLLKSIQIICGLLCKRLKAVSCNDRGFSDLVPLRFGWIEVISCIRLVPILLPFWSANTCIYIF